LYEFSDFFFIHVSVSVVMYRALLSMKLYPLFVILIATLLFDEYKKGENLEALKLDH